MAKSILAIRETLLQTPRVVEGLIAAATDDILTWREADGAWNCVEILCHLADGEITDWMPRLELIVSGGGRFAPFDREAGFIRYRGWAADALVGEFGQRRRANVARLHALDLTSDHLQLTGEHPEFGTVTLQQLLACWATHDMAHVSQISRVLTRAFGRDIGPWRQYFSLLQGAERQEGR
jgi:DinB superfamily